MDSEQRQARQTRMEVYLPVTRQAGQVLGAFLPMYEPLDYHWVEDSAQ